MSKKPVHQIIDALTPEAIMARLGVSFHMIRHARTTGMFPASWYDDIEKMSRKAGIDCPRSLFNWKSAANNIGRASRDCKAVASK